MSGFVPRLLRTFDGDMCELLWWRWDAGEPVFYVLVNDVFEWGTADVETIDPEDLDDLEKAIEECRALGSEDSGPDLWVARKRGVRPQGAWYKHIDVPLHPLFDAAGPVREVNILNPHGRQTP